MESKDHSLPVSGEHLSLGRISESAQAPVDPESSLTSIAKMKGRYRLRTEDGSLIIADFDRHTVWRIPGPTATHRRMPWTWFNNGYAVVGERSQWQFGALGEKYISSPIVSIERFDHDADIRGRTLLQRLLAEQLRSGRTDGPSERLLETFRFVMTDAHEEDPEVIALRRIRQYSERLWRLGPLFVDNSIDRLLIGQLIDRSSDDELLEWVRSTGRAQSEATALGAGQSVESIKIGDGHQGSQLFRIVTDNASVLIFDQADMRLELAVDRTWGHRPIPNQRVVSFDQVAVGKQTMWVFGGEQSWLAAKTSFIDDISGSVQGEPPGLTT